MAPLDLAPLGGAWGLAFRVAGVRETVARFQADAEANWIPAHEPEVWARTRRYGLLSSWLTARMVGRWVDSAAAQVGYLPFDFKHFRYMIEALDPVTSTWVSRESAEGASP